MTTTTQTTPAPPPARLRPPPPWPDALPGRATHDFLVLNQRPDLTAEFPLPNFWAGSFPRQT